MGMSRIPAFLRPLLSLRPSLMVPAAIALLTALPGLAMASQVPASALTQRLFPGWVVNVKTWVVRDPRTMIVAFLILGGLFALAMALAQHQIHRPRRTRSFRRRRSVLY